MPDAQSGEVIASATDVRRLFDFLLGRPPESPAVEAEAACQPLRALRDAMLDGGEFFEVGVRAVLGSMTPSPLLSRPLEPGVAEWVVQTFDLAPTPPSRVALMAAVIRRRAAEPSPSLSADVMEAVAQRLDLWQAREGGAAARPATAASLVRLASALRPAMEPEERSRLLLGLRFLETGAFDPDYYLAAHPDVAAAGIDPTLHYILHGEEEGRRPAPRFDPEVYRREHGVEPGVSVLQHAILSGDPTADPGETPGHAAPERSATAPTGSLAVQGAPHGEETRVALRPAFPGAARRLVFARDSRLDRRGERIERLFGAAMTDRLGEIVQGVNLAARSGTVLAELVDDIVVARWLLGAPGGGDFGRLQTQAAALANVCLHRGESRTPEEARDIPLRAARLRRIEIGSTFWADLPLDALLAGLQLLLGPSRKGTAPPWDAGDDPWATMQARSSALAEVLTQHAREPAVQVLIDPATRAALRAPGASGGWVIEQMLSSEGSDDDLREGSASTPRTLWSRGLEYVLSGEELAQSQLRIEREGGVRTLVAPPLVRETSTWRDLESRARHLEPRELQEAVGVLAEQLPPLMTSGSVFEARSFERRRRPAGEVGWGRRLPIGAPCGFGSDAGQCAPLGEGWGEARPSHTGMLRPTVMAALAVAPEGRDADLDLLLTMSLEGGSGCRLALRWNGELLGVRSPRGEGDHAFLFFLGRRADHDGLNILALSVRRASPTGEPDARPAPRNVGVALRDLTLIPR